MGGLDKQLRGIEAKKIAFAKKISNNKKSQKKAIQADVIVSEHAILRYFERIHKVDMKNMEKLILPTKIKAEIKKAKGYGKFYLKDDIDNKIYIVVADYIVVTVVDENQPRVDDKEEHAHRK